MKMMIYSIKDVDAKELGPIFTAKNDEVAKRNFKSLLDSGKCEYPNSLVLCSLNVEFDSESIDEPLCFALEDCKELTGGFLVISTEICKSSDFEGKEVN